MSNACTFTGTTNRIPEYTLGSKKQIKGEVEIIKKGSKRGEDIKSPSWKIGQEESHIIKDYSISVDKGKVYLLSEKDYSQNPINFKSWICYSNQKFVKCSGKFNNGENIIAAGSMQIKRIKGIYQDISLETPMIIGVIICNIPSWHFSLRLEGKIKLDGESLINGTIGILNLVKVNRTANNGKTIILKTDNFVLHTYKKNDQSPILDSKQVNNSLIDDPNSFNIYQIDFPLNQIIKEEDQSYIFDDTVRSYFFFKGNKEGDIWHPVGFENNDLTNPSYIEWQYKADFFYDKEKQEWKFNKYEHTTPKLVKVEKLPEWDKSIWD